MADIRPYPRVLRGGIYDSEAADCRSAARAGSNKLMNAVDPQIPKSPHWMSDGFFIGFRVVAPAKVPPWMSAGRNGGTPTIRYDRNDQTRS